MRANDQQGVGRRAGVYARISTDRYGNERYPRIIVLK
jgi:hypothetical protein